MPIYKDFSDEKCSIFVFKYDENEEYNAAELIEIENLPRFENYHEKKLLEVMMVRKILREKLPGAKIFYNENAPFLQPREFEISVSHSFPYAALAFSKQKIGIDLETFRDKIIRVKDKFINEEEQQFIPENQLVEYLTVIWSIKESLYKLHHSKHWSLKKHYEVRPFSMDDLSSITCRVHDDFTSDFYTARAEIFDGFVFTVVG